MNGTGPEKKGPQTGRGLGRCKNTSEEEALQKLGAGQAHKRKSGGGKGQGNRLKTSPRKN